MTWLYFVFVQSVFVFVELTLALAMMYAQLLDITVQAFGFFLCVHALLVTLWTATNRSNIIGGDPALQVQSS
jgi:hypothetical protein